MASFDLHDTPIRTPVSEIPPVQWWFVCYMLEVILSDLGTPILYNFPLKQNPLADFRLLTTAVKQSQMNTIIFSTIYVL